MAVRADDVDLVRDRSLVELCQAGDEAAFGDLYTRYYQRLLRFCVRRVGNVHEAEEITQEAFARAFTAMPRFAGERRFYPWLTVIAARLCIDSHRRVARSEPTADIDPGAVDGGQQQVIDNVDLAYLSQAMEQLGPRHREVLELRETHGWSYQQIADHYNVTMGTVEALLFRARKALRREFLTLAGPDARLASLPIFGVMWRLAARARMHLDELGSHLAPAAAATAMGAAAMATSLGFGGAAAIPAAAAKAHPVSMVSNLSTEVTAGSNARLAPQQYEAGAVVNQASQQPVTTFGKTDAATAHEDEKSGLAVGRFFVATDTASVGTVKIGGVRR